MSPKERVIITGGGGFIGAQVSKTFAAAGYDVVVIDRGARKWATKKYTAFSHDFFSSSTADVLEKFKPNTFIHLAASHVIQDSVIDPGKYYKNNVSGTQTILDMCIKAGVKNFIFSSSSSVYGERESRELFKEDMTPMPITPYAKSKHMTELMLEDYNKAYGLNYVSIRNFNAAGADPEGQNGYTQEPAKHVIPIIIDKILKNKDFIIFGNDYQTPDGTTLRDYCHIQDIADAKLKAVNYLNNGGKSGIFNISSGIGFSIMDIIKSVEKVIGKELKYKIGERREGDSPFLCGDISKAKEFLGWSPKYNLDDMVKHSVLWENNKLNAVKNL